MPALEADEAGIGAVFGECASGLRFRPLGRWEGFVPHCDSGMAGLHAPLMGWLMELYLTLHASAGNGRWAANPHASHQE
jgi:hypothetical protein